MIQISKSQRLSFEAEVVEVFEKNDRRIAKVLVHSFFLEVDADEISGAHLGDKVLFSAGVETDPAPDFSISAREPGSLAENSGVKHDGI